MAAKALMPNQCVPLHILYGPQDCCLCNAKVEHNLLKEDIRFLLEFIDEDFVSSDRLEWFKSRMELIRKRLNT